MAKLMDLPAEVHVKIASYLVPNQPYTMKEFTALALFEVSAYWRQTIRTAIGQIWRSLEQEITEHTAKLGLPADCWIGASEDYRSFELALHTHYLRTLVYVLAKFEKRDFEIDYDVVQASLRTQSFLFPPT